MSRPEQSVVQAKAALANAERDLEAAQIATAKGRLQEIRSEGRRVKTELDGLVLRVRRLDSDIANARADLAGFADAIRAHLAQKPAASDFPTDDELAAWQAELARLESAQLAQSRRVWDLEHARTYPVQQALDLDGALGRLRTQQRNLESLARGEKIGQPWEGGISAV